MLRRLKESEFEQYVAFAWQLAMDLSHSGFPVYTDSVHTKEDFLRKGRAGLSRENEEILLFEENGAVEGWIHYYYIAEDEYLGVSGIWVRNGTAKALAELFAYWTECYPEAAWHLYFPEENREAQAFLEERGFRNEEGEIVDVLLFEDYSVKEESGCVVRIDSRNFNIFRGLHARFEEEMYWTSDRIAKTPEQWEIFAHVEGGECQGALYYHKHPDGDYEIFGIDMPEDGEDMEVIEKLLISGLNRAKTDGARSMYFFNDRKTHAISERLGFRYITTAYYFEGRCC